MDLQAPFTLETSQVLPGGIRNPRFIDFSMTAGQRFRSDGSIEPLGALLNRPITWNDVFDSQDSKTTAKGIVDIIKKAGLDPTGIAGQATGVVNARIDVRVPVIGVGITDKLTMALAVPIVNAQISASSGFIRSPGGQASVDEIGKISPERANYAANHLNDPVNSKLQRLGYQPLGSETISGLGDIQLVSKYQWHQDPDSGFATKLVIGFPTGTDSNPDKVIDVTTGYNRFQIGALAQYDHRLYDSLGTNLFLGYTALMPNQMVKRLPYLNYDPLSGDKETLTRELGHIVSFGAMLNYEFESAGLRVAAGYNFQSLSGTRYSGSPQDSSYTRQRIGLLTAFEPDQILHCFVTTVGFSTVNWYLKKKFFLPFQLNAVYSKPIAGRNVPVADVVAGEVILFF